MKNQPHLPFKIRNSKGDGDVTVLPAEVGTKAAEDRRYPVKDQALSCSFQSVPLKVYVHSKLMKWVWFRNKIKACILITKKLPGNNEFCLCGCFSRIWLN